MAFVERYESKDELYQGANAEIVVTKMIIDKPCICQALHPPELKKNLKKLSWPRQKIVLLI